MKLRLLMNPATLGFALRGAGQSLAEKITGAPPRPVQVARYVAQHAKAGDPQDVLDTIDRFAREERWLMNVGPEKGPLIEELAGRIPPEARVLELGAYCGYSSIMMAQAFGAGTSITSIEISEAAVESSRANVAVAGLSDRISFLHGPSGDMIPGLDGRFDLVFLDHWKDLYKDDLVAIEELGLIGPGSIVVADNVGEIYAPEAYLDYVRNCGRYNNEHREAAIEYTKIPDAVEISVYLGSGPAQAG